MWDLVPGRPFPYLYNTIHEVSSLFLIGKDARQCSSLLFYARLISRWKSLTRYGENVEPESWTFMDREKSKGEIASTPVISPTDTAVFFKKSWFARDLEPGSQERRREADTIVKQMNKYQDTLSTRLS